MAQVIKAPCVVSNNKPALFLAGTIDNGFSTDWQSTIPTKLSELDILILNPRRDDWDSSWQQTISNPDFREQVEWELDGLENSKVVLMYFAAQSKSPITLLELGLVAKSKKIVIACPQGFWRRGNLEVLAKRYDIPLYESLNDAIEYVKGLFKERELN